MLPQNRSVSPSFSVWMQRGGSKSSPRYAVKFDVVRGMGALRLDQVGAVTPTLRRSQLGGLTAGQLQRGRFMHFLPEGGVTLQEYDLWMAREAPTDLPLGRWIRMNPCGNGLVPEGWTPGDVTIDDDDITDIAVGRAGLGIAMQVLKERRRAVQDVPFAPPTGLVRHLKRTVQRQEAEILALKAELAALRSGSGS